MCFVGVFVCVWGGEGCVGVSLCIICVCVYTLVWTSLCVCLRCVYVFMRVLCVFVCVGVVCVYRGVVCVRVRACLLICWILHIIVCAFPLQYSIMTMQKIMTFLKRNKRKFSRSACLRNATSST